ncbi:HPP family protein [Trinickia sp. LjRoot230]|uniref:HPP family protein n=1 Tax=Trinickia sp. LjRoot230 TaxID=3342288 RepID=UPI003ECF8E14
MSRVAIARWLLSFVPNPVTVPWQERLRSCIGAFIGIAVTGATMHWLVSDAAHIPLLVAPMGASAVLLFAAPASPLAQPWSFIGGNVVAATLGVLASHWFADPVVAAAFAVAAATSAMFALRCVHPPSGAVALTAVLGGPAVHALGFRFVVEPIAVQSFVLLTAAIAYHTVTGHRYPHVRRATPSDRAADTAGTGVTRADIEALVRKQGELIDVAAEDLQTLLHKAQLLTYARSFSDMTCAQIMSRDVVTVTAETTAATAWRLLERHRVKALPVVDGIHHVVGVVTRTDFVRRTPFGLRAIRAARLSVRRDVAATRRVGEFMTSAVCTADASLAVAKLIPLFAHYGHHHIPVLDAQRRLVGMITQSDLIGGLHRQSQTQRLRSA